VRGHIRVRHPEGLVPLRALKAVPQWRDRRTPKAMLQAFDLCSPRRSLAHRREAVRNSALVTRLVLNMVPRFNVCPSNSGAAVLDGFSAHNRSTTVDHLAASPCSERGKLVWREICELRPYFPGVPCVGSNENWDTSVEELRQ